MALGELQVLGPVKGGDVVFAGADVVADGVADGGIDGGLLVDTEALFAEERVNWFGVFPGEEFAVGVGPAVTFGAANVNRAGGEEGDEHVLIDGEGCFVVVVLLEVVVEPVWEGGVDAFDGFAEGAAGEGGAAAAGFVGDDEGEARVGGAGPEGGFAET